MTLSTLPCRAKLKHSPLPAWNGTTTSLCLLRSHPLPLRQKNIPLPFAGEELSKITSH